MINLQDEKNKVQDFPVVISNSNFNICLTGILEPNIYWGTVNGYNHVIVRTEQEELVVSSSLTKDYIAAQVDLTDNFDHYSFSSVACKKDIRKKKLIR